VPVAGDHPVGDRVGPSRERRERDRHDRGLADDGLADADTGSVAVGHHDRVRRGLHRTVEDEHHLRRRDIEGRARAR
jgi:hypothetical protein